MRGNGGVGCLDLGNQQCTCISTHHTIHFNTQNYICQLFHNKVGEEGNAASDLFPDTGLRVNFFFSFEV